MRSAARHICPEAMKVPASAACTACSMLASSQTIIGSLPPSSRMAGVSVLAHCVATRRPLGIEPVKTILSTPDSHKATPVSA